MNYCVQIHKKTFIDTHDLSDVFSNIHTNISILMANIYIVIQTL